MGVTVETLHATEGIKPQPDDYVQIRFVGRTADDEVFDKSPPTQPFSFRAGHHEVLSELEEGVMQMREGEEAKITVPALADGPKLGLPEGDLTFRVELELVTTPKDKTVDMTPEMRLDFARTEKEAGSAHFKAGELKDARRRYLMAVDVLTEDEWADTSVQKPLLEACRLNAALAATKLELWREAIDICTAVLQDSPENPKALYRRAAAYLGFEFLDQAAEDLRLAAKLEPGNKEVRQLFAKVKAQGDKAKEKQRAAAAAMFGGPAAERPADAA